MLIVIIGLGASLVSCKSACGIVRALYAPATCVYSFPIYIGERIHARNAGICARCYWRARRPDRARSSARSERSLSAHPSLGAPPVLSAAIRGPTMTASATRCVVAADKQRQWNDKRNDKQDRVNKGPARAEKRTSARQARVAYNHPANGLARGGWVVGGDG